MITGSRSNLAFILSWFGLMVIFAHCSDQKKKLLFLGDSMTVGDEIDPKYTFTALLDHQIPGINTINLARSGWSTSSYLHRWEEVESDFPSRADFVFIQLGADDIKTYGHNDSTITLCIANMKVIMKKIESHFPSAEIVLMSSTKIDYSNMDQGIKEAGFNASSNTYLSRIAEGYSIIASEKNCNFIDLHRLVPIQNTYDGAHLDKNGHRIVAEVIRRFLRELMLLEQEKEDKK